MAPARHRARMANSAPPALPVVFGAPFCDIEEQYALVKNGDLGIGGWGTVRAYTRRGGGGERFACKTVFKSDLLDDDDVEGLRAEVQAMRDLQDCANVVHLKDVFEDDVCVHLVMDLCDGGDLFDLIATKGRLAEGEAAALFRQIVTAVGSCHVGGWLHRDIKPENIFLCRKVTAASVLLSLFARNKVATVYEAKLGDFGLAMAHAPGELHEGIAGSPCYMAPEIVIGDMYMEKVDLWSLGVVLYAMLAGEQPFNGSTTSEIFEASKLANVDLEKGAWLSISPEAKDLVQQLIQSDPEKRPSVAEVLEHPWLTAVEEEPR